MRRLLLILIGICFLPPSLLPATAQQADLATMVSRDSVAAAVLRPQQMLASPLLELFPHEVVETFGQEQLGLSVKAMDYVVLSVQLDRQRREPTFLATIHFDKPQAFQGQAWNELKSGDINGQQFYQIGPPRPPVLLKVRDPQTILIGTRSRMPGAGEVAEAGGDGEVQALLTRYPADKTFQLYGSIGSVRGLIKENLPPGDQVPPPFQMFLELPDLAEYVYLTADLTDTLAIEGRIGAVDEEAAKKIVRIKKKADAMGRAALMAQLADAIKGQSEEMQLSINTYVDRLMTAIEEASEPQVQGNELIYDGGTDGNGYKVASVATIGILTGMLLPAVQQVREAARRTQGMNNLRQMALACLNYESAFARFPQRAIYSEDGRPLLSWRVAILPFIEQNALYEQFHLDEPWDSEHNIQLLDQMPETYAAPGANLEPGMTVYQGFTGEDTVWPDGPDAKVGFRDIVDGSSNTILIVESDESAAVEWSRPADIEFNPDVPIDQIGNFRVGVFNAVFCDGSSHAIDNFIDWESLSNLIMRNDGNIVNYP